MDIQKTWMMLEIIDKSRHWPPLKPIHDWAMAQLQEISDEVVKAAANQREHEQKRLQAAEDTSTRAGARARPIGDLRTQGTDQNVDRPSLSSRMQTSGDSGDTELRRP